MFPMPPQVTAAWAAVRAFCATAKFGVYVVFAILFLFLIFGSKCKKEDPHVTLNETPAQVEQIVVPVIEHHDQAVVNDQQKQAETAKVVVAEEKKAVKKTAKILKDPGLTEEQKHTQVGEAQMDQLESLYAQYYGGAPPGGASADTPASSTS